MTASREDVRLVLKQLDAWAAEGARRLVCGGEPVALSELHIELTHRCDLKCVMCHHWEMPTRLPDSVSRELRVDDFRRLARSPRLRGVRTVAVTGGEPLLRPEAVEIVAILRAAFPDASLGILSNLWNPGSLRRRLGELRERGVADFWLGSSLDGLGDDHDRVRGQPGAFRGLEASLDMLKKEFPQTRVSVNFTILPDNADRLWEVYRYARDRELGFGAQFVVDHEGFEAPRRFSWSEERLDAAAAQIDLVIEDLCRRHSALERLVARPPEQSRWLWSQLLYWSRLR